MIIKFEKYNESIKDTNGVGLLRSKMTPRSKDEIEKAYINLISSIDNPATDMAPEWQEEFKNLADMINTPINDLHIIDEDKTDYELVDEYFNDLIIGEKEILVEIPQSGDFEGGTYKVYPKQKIIYWSSNIHDNLHVWIFSKSYFTKVNESIRDKMTPKPTEDIVKNLKNMNPVLYNKYKKDLGVDIPEESEPLIYQVWRDMKKRFPNETSELHLRDLGSFGQDMEFNSVIDNRSIYVSHSEISDNVMFKIYPFKKIRRLEDLIVANNYMLENIEQYNEMIEELVKDEKPMDRFKNFFKFNESIRDMMTPKTREEILNSLKGNRDVIFKPSDNTSPNMMGEIGNIEVSYEDLHKLFGEPNGYTDEYKVSTAWDLVDNQGRYVGIEDWKSTRLFDNDPELPTVKQFRRLPSYNWIIIGQSDVGEELAEDLRTYIISHII